MGYVRDPRVPDDLSVCDPPIPCTTCIHGDDPSQRCGDCPDYADWVLKCEEAPVAKERMEKGYGVKEKP